MNVRVGPPNEVSYMQFVYNWSPYQILPMDVQDAIEPLLIVVNHAIA